MYAAKVFENLGAEVCLINLASLEYAVPAYYIISSAEASSNLARYDGIRYGKTAKNYSNLDEMYVNTRTEGFGTEVKRRIFLGTFALSSGYYEEYYKKAINAKNLIINEFSDVFKKFDIVLTPTAPTTAFRLGEKTKPIDNYLCDLYTVPANLAGLPAMSVPCGRSSNNGMPIGVQLIGKAFDEMTLFKAGYALEQIVSEDNR
jgi:aspartyl-tRNA(Asn)/glutamyl-tRNA(Gln) amidotransferase subunit A